MPDVPKNDPTISIQQQMLKETQQLRAALEKQSQSNQPKAIGSKPVENKNKVGENRMGLPTPFPVVVTDETGSDKHAYLDLINQIEENTRQGIEQEKNFHKEAIKEEEFSRKRDNFNYKEAKEVASLNVDVNKKKLGLAELALKQNKEQKGIMQRWGELIRKEGLIKGGVTGILRAPLGKLSDKITGGLRETIGKVPQFLNLKEGAYSKSIDESMARTAKLEIEAADQRLDYQLSVLRKQALDLDEKRAKGELSKEEYEKGVEAISEQEEKISTKRETLEKDLLSRSERIQLRIADNQSEELNKIFDMLKKQHEASTERGSIYVHDIHAETLLEKLLENGTQGSSDQKTPSTYTEEEQEKIERRSTRLLSSIVQELTFQNKFLYQAADTKSDKAFNVRLVEIKEGLEFGTEGKTDKKEKGGLFDWLFKGLGKFGGLIKGILPALGSLGATLGGGVGAGAVGLLGATAALGASLWTLKESVQTTLHLRKAEREAIKTSNKAAENRAKTLEIEAKELSTTRKKLHAYTETGFDRTKEYLDREGKNLSKDILQKKREVGADKVKRVEERMRELQKKGEDYEKSSWLMKASKFVTEGGKVSGRSAAEDKELERLRRERGQLTGSQAAIDQALQEKNFKKVKQGTKEGFLEASKETNKSRLSESGYVGEASTTREVRKLRESLEDIFKKHTDALTEHKDTNFAEYMSRRATTSPLTVPDNTLSKEPSAPEQTGVIKT